MFNEKNKIAVVGLGYVGLPLAIEFGAQIPTIGFDISQSKLKAYRKGIDPSGEVSSSYFERATKVYFTSDESEISQADVVIVAVPTPIDHSNKPDFTPLLSATNLVGNNLKKGAIVVFESTVYPGATEELCIPILEKQSGFKWKSDFFIGYSPERINPGDKQRTLTKIVKVVSGDTPETLSKVSCLYASIITAGVHEAPSIAVAEAAKVIENTQRDLNISLMNELAMIFERLDIDTHDVLEAAQTKWNFLPFTPGLVGGHCIGVDPYYLTYKAEAVGYHPQVILSGRRINDGMASYLAKQIIKSVIANSEGPLSNAKITVLGLTFKENCSDIRNTKIVNLISELRDFGVEVNVHDPVASPDGAQSEYGISLSNWNTLGQANAIVLAVPHDEYLERDVGDFQALLTPDGVVWDVKSVLNRNEFGSASVKLFRL